jgi:hypothetical protein
MGSRREPGNPKEQKWPTTGGRASVSRVPPFLPRADYMSVLSSPCGIAHTAERQSVEDALASLGVRLSRVYTRSVFYTTLRRAQSGDGLLCNR